MQAIARACAITRINWEKGASGGLWNIHPKINLRGLISPVQNLSQIHFKWFKRIHFKLNLLTLLFKSLFFRKNVNCNYVLFIDVFSIIMQWRFCKYVLLKKIKNIFNKSVFANRKLIVIIYSRIVQRILQTWNMYTKNKLILYRQ